jgi:acetoacetate decarboxylase
MSLQGRLTKDKMAATMPVDAPAYHRKPFYYKKARWMRFDYETDADSAAELLPEQLSLTDPPIASLSFVDYPWSTIGAYHEAILAIQATYGDEQLIYLTHLILDSITPILVGRDLYGFPKKMGCVEFVQEEDMTAAFVERPRGIRICSGVMRMEQQLDPLPDGMPLKTCSLRVIPSPEKDKDHSLVELIQTDLIVSSVEMWTGPGSCHFTGASALDPWHKLPVKEMMSCIYMIFDFELSYGRILETL